MTRKTRFALKAAASAVITTFALALPAAGQTEVSPMEQVPTMVEVPTMTPVSSAAPVFAPAPSAIPAPIMAAVSAKTPALTLTPASLTTAAPVDVEIVSPAPHTLLDVPAATLVLRFAEGSTVMLSVNGRPVSASQIGRTETDSATHTVTQTWYGLALQEGDNTIAAQTVSGTATGHLVTLPLHVRAAPALLVLRAATARTPADGRSVILFTGLLLDKSGSRTNQDATITLLATAGEWVGTDADPDQPGFQIKVHQGQFSAALRAGLKAQTVHLRAAGAGLETFSQVEFLSDLRPSLVTGVVNLRVGDRRTDIYQSMEDFLPVGGSDALKPTGSAAGFATGKVGGYLFTGAYNSDHPLNQTQNGASSLGRDTQVSDQAYPVTGDSSTSEALAQSRDHLYARFERNQDFVMWGDYGTEEFAGKSQEFTALTRQFHAFKVNYNFGALQTTGFYGNNVQGFQRDTIAPDGTSGSYYLSHRPLVYGSENVFLEMEDLVHPGTVVERTPAARGADYEIDYDRGTLVFHAPIQRTDIGPDGAALVRRIVVTYQYETQGANTNVYGTRLQYHLGADHAGLLGATYLRQDQGVRSFDLYGADTLLPLGKAGTLIAEYGHSHNTSELLGTVNGSAYRVQADARIAPGIQGSAYWHAADTGFANDATTSFVPGQSRYGALVLGTLSPWTHVRLQVEREDNKGLAPQPADTLLGVLDPGAAPAQGTTVNNSLQTISAGIEQRIQHADLAVDLISRKRTDRIASDAGALAGSSSQLQTRFGVPLTPKLSFQAQNDTTLSSAPDAVFPDRTLLSLLWAVRPDVSLRLGQQFFGRGQFSGHSLTSVDLIGSHKFGGDSDLSERVSLIGGANAWTIQQALGLDHRWALAPGLHLSAGFENVGGAFFGRTGAGNQTPQPYAVGQSASSLGVTGGSSENVAVDYLRGPDFKASARYENHASSGGNSHLLTAAAAGKLSAPLTALLSYQQASSSNQGLAALGQTSTLRLGLAYRDPRRDTVNLLLRYESRVNPALVPGTLLLGSGTGSREQLFAVETIYAPQWQWEFYGKLALRDSTTLLAQDFTGSSRLSLAQGRITYRARYNVDIVGDLRVIRLDAADYTSLGTSVEVGYYLNPDLRLSCGYNFGRIDDRDFTGNRSAGRIFFGLTAKVNELFSGFGLQKDASQKTDAQQTNTQKTSGTAAPIAKP